MLAHKMRSRCTLNCHVLRFEILISFDATNDKRACLDESVRMTRHAAARY